MKGEKDIINRGEGGRFLPGHNIRSPGRDSVPGNVREYFQIDSEPSRIKLKAVANGKELLVNGKSIKYNEYFWLDCVKLCLGYAWGRPSVQVELKDVTPPMTDEEKSARSENIDNLALMRAKKDLKVIEVNSENKGNDVE